MFVTKTFIFCCLFERLGVRLIVPVPSTAYIVIMLLMIVFMLLMMVLMPNFPQMILAD